MQILRFALSQLNPVFRCVDNNIETLLDISQSTNADILLFPELATCGYFYQSHDEILPFTLARTDEKILQFQEIANRKNMTICFGFAEQSFANDRFSIYNSSALFVPNTPEPFIYRKTHLFYKERYCFEQGDSGFFVVDDPAHNCKIGMMICYDWRFPEAARSLMLKGAEIILCPSNLVTNIWTKVMPTRAVENKIILAVANRWGSEENATETVTFNGLSSLYDYNGEVIVQASQTGDVLLVGECDIEPVRNKSFNSENNIVADRRPNLYLND